MNTKKLIVFLLWAFLPMVIVGVVMHLSGAVIKGMLLSAGAMFTPLLSVILTQLIFKEPVLKNLGISYKINRWWCLGWLLMPLIAFAVLGVTLLMSGAQWTPDNEMMQKVMQSLPEGIGIWVIIVIAVISGLMSGITINAVFAFGEEIAWRGFLMKEFKGQKFLVAALWIGIIWLIFGGLHTAIEYFIAGLVLMITIIGIPWGKMHFRLAKLALSPFGMEVV